jgi:hypothetical protein
MSCKGNWILSAKNIKYLDKNILECDLRQKNGKWKRNILHFEEHLVYENNDGLFTCINRKEKTEKVLNKQETKKLKISVIICAYNSESYIKYIDKLFNRVEKLYSNYEFEYFFYENDSKDNTKRNILNFFNNNRKGNHWMENSNSSRFVGDISKSRGNYMKIIRNKLKQKHGILNSDYTMLLDCDVVFQPYIIKKFIDSFVNDIVMVTPFCICYENYNETKGANLHYYDSLALISNDDISYKENDNTCLFKNCRRCRNHLKSHHIFIREKYLFNSTDTIIPVKSAFGSCAMIKTKVYNKVSWGNSICEHHSFCNKIRNFGKIIINQKLKMFNVNRIDNNYDGAESKLNFIN